MQNIRSFIVSRPFRLSVIALALTICAFGIAGLSVEIKQKIESQSTAPTDNGQWFLAQVDVEVLNLLTAVSDASENPAELAEVRRRFDIFYSRMSMLRGSQLFRPLNQDPNFSSNSASIWAFLDHFVVVIDGPDTALEAALPQMKQELRAVRLATRAVSLSGIRTFAEQSDAKRLDMLRTLTNIAVLTFLLVLVLLALVGILLRLDQINRAHARENMMALSRIQAIVTTSLDAMIVADYRGRILEFNHAAERIFDHKRAAVLGRDLADIIIPPALRAAHSKGMASYKKDGKTQLIGKGRVKLDGMRADQSIVPLEVSISRADSVDGVIFVAFLRDVSAQIAAERDLLKARDDALAGEKAKADLLAVMSHEMRTPLNGMLGTMELLDDTALQPKQRDYLRVIEVSGRLLLHHVNDVLDMARLDSGKLTLKPQAVDLGTLVQDIFENQQANAQAHNNLLTLTLPKDGRTTVITDPALLRQIMMNLIGNALKFTRNGMVTVEISHHAEDGTSEFRVMDTGIGIAPHDLERIFDDFVTLDTSYARTADGTGLGLGIARRIAQSMGGSLQAESTVGIGSTFRLIVPMDVISIATKQPKTAKNRRKPLRAAKQRAGLNVLIVEDNAVNRLVVREMLSKLGHVVQEAHDGEMGVRIANEMAFDLIFMDISMPLMDGIQATKAIRAGNGLSQKAPIIALTAHALADEIAAFGAAGMQDVLIKPVSRHALETAIEQARQALPPKPPVLIDSDILAHFLEDIGLARATRLLDAFLNATDAAITDFKGADVSAETLPDLTREVHKLCGSAAIYGAVAFASALRQQELVGKAGDVAGYAAGLIVLEQLWQQTRVAFVTARDRWT